MCCATPTDEWPCYWPLICGRGTVIYVVNALCTITALIRHKLPVGLDAPAADAPDGKFTAMQIIPPNKATAHVTL